MGMYEDEDSGTQSIYKVRPWRRLSIHVCLFVNDVIVVKQTMNLETLWRGTKTSAINNVNDSPAMNSCLQCSYLSAQMVMADLAMFEVIYTMGRTRVRRGFHTVERKFAATLFVLACVYVFVRLCLNHSRSAQSPRSCKMV